MPPITSKVVTSDGTVLLTGQEIRDGQNVWQSAGGQQMGSVWGHGAYVAPDWSADWLEREAVWLLAPTGLMNDWAITRERALELGRTVMRDNALRLYHTPSPVGTPASPAR